MDSFAEMHELLPWYITGTLEPRLAEAFQRHLGACDACQREMSMLEALRRELDEHGGALLEEHPTSEHVVGAVRGELPDQTAAAVRKHLALCESCAEEASWVAGQGTYGTPVVEARPSRRAGRIWTWAAGIAAVLVLGAVPWLLVRGPDRARTGVVSVYHLEPARRGASEANVFTLVEGRTEVVLIAQVDVPAESFPLTVSLLDGHGSTLRSQPDVSSLLDGYLHYVCARSDCPAGNYTLEVYESGGDGPALSFDFELVEP